MKSASNTLPDQAPQDLTAGLDWARDDHAVSIVNDRGREIARHTIEHTAAGLIELVAVLTRAGCQEVVFAIQDILDEEKAAAQAAADAAAAAAA